MSLFLFGRSVIIGTHNKEKSEHPVKDTPIGRSEVTRTPDLLVPNQARYQTALHPEISLFMLPHEAHKVNNSKQKTACKFAGGFFKNSFT